jgi:hypothetical protein
VTVLIIFALATGEAAFAQTAHTKKSKAQKSKSPDEAQPGAAGQQASIDPQTGKLKEPSREEADKIAAEMEKNFKRSPEQLAVTQRSDGTIVVELTEEYMDVSVVTINSDGNLTVSCVKGVKAADALVKGEAKPADAAKPSQSPATDAGAADTGKATVRSAKRPKAKTVKAPAAGRKE